MRNTENNLPKTISECISSESSLRVLVDLMAEMDLEVISISPSI